MFLLKKFPKFFGTVTALMLATTLTACFSSGGNSTNPTTVVVPLAITSTAPVQSEANVGTNVKVVAVFNKAMNPDTLNVNTFTLIGTTGPDITGTVTYFEATRAATFAPTGTNQLTDGETYTATVTTEVKDESNKALSKNHVWTFVVGADTVDLTASTSPENDAKFVELNKKVSVAFSKAIDPATVKKANFKLAKTGSTADIAGILEYVNPTTVVFSPSSNLEKETKYTFELTADIKDTTGTSLTATEINFETGLEAAVNSTAIDLRTAGNYVILTKTGISTTGETKITGDVAVSPAAQSFLTGFDETPVGDHATSTDIVTGKLFAADMASPTPSDLTSAVADMQLAYTDAAGRSNPDSTELGAGNISGMTLAPGLYKWSTGLLINTDVTLNGSSKDVWIFQIAGDLTIGNAVEIKLAGGALPKNIYWQVAGAVTMGTTSKVKGNLLSQTRIEMKTGAELIGRALAQTAVTLDANTVKKPAQ